MYNFYTYEIDLDLFFENLIIVLQDKDTTEEENILNIIKGAKCFIKPLVPTRPIKPIYPRMPNHLINSPFSSYSMIDPFRAERNSYHNKLDHYKTENSIYEKECDYYNGYKEKSVQIDAITYFSVLKIPKNIQKIKDKLLDICNQIMPPETGFYIKSIQFRRLLNENNHENKLDIEELSKEWSNEIIGEILPEDIEEKGKEMAEVYMYLYCVENSLRLFIDKIAEEKLGNNYFDELNINTDIKKMIRSRKQNETKNKWLGVRGDSDLFYLDFEDLNKIIVNNWNIFKPYFPDQNWITTKIKEMADCRNLVAHNSFIEEHGRNVIKTNYVSILRQLDSVLRI